MSFQYSVFLFSFNDRCGTNLNKLPSSVEQWSIDKYSLFLICLSVFFLSIYFLGPQKDLKHFMMAGQLAHQVCVISPWQSLFVPAPGRWVVYALWKHHSIPDCFLAFLKPFVVSVFMICSAICCSSVVALMVCWATGKLENSTTFKWQCLNISCSEHPSLKFL